MFWYIIGFVLFLGFLAAICDLLEYIYNTRYPKQ